MIRADGAIGVMDSGVGGVSALHALRALLPCEDFIYFGDVKNAPYGTKTASQIKRAVFRNSELLLGMGCKALVIACNTATAVAVEELRELYPDVPIVGMEPAVRPALTYAKINGGDVLVLATGVTVREKRFLNLCDSACRQLGGRLVSPHDMEAERVTAVFDSVALIPVAAQKVVEFIEKGMGDSTELTEYLTRLLYPYRNRRFGAVVAGCTHFPFAEKSILSALGYPVRFFDGGKGAAKRLRYLLEKENSLRDNCLGRSGYVLWLCSENGERGVEYVKLARILCR